MNPTPPAFFFRAIVPPPPDLCGACGLEMKTIFWLRFFLGTARHRGMRASSATLALALIEAVLDFRLVGPYTGR